MVFSIYPENSSSYGEISRGAGAFVDAFVSDCPYSDSDGSSNYTVDLVPAGFARLFFVTTLGLAAVMAFLGLALTDMFSYCAFCSSSESTFGY
jgi:hypothetical protein